MLGRELAVLQAPMLDGPCLCLTLCQGSVGERHIVPALVLQLVAVVLDKDLVLDLKVAGQGIGFQQLVVSRGPVPAPDLVVSLRMARAPRTRLISRASM